MDPQSPRFLDRVRSDWQSNPGYSLDTLKARLLLLIVRAEQSVYEWHQRTSAPGHSLVWAAVRFIGSILQWRLFSCEISGAVDIGLGLRLPHPQNIIIRRWTRIGDYCSVYHNVTFALSTFRARENISTVVGDRVVVGANAVVIGDIHIGDDAIVAAGAVVTKDVPAGHTVTPAQTVVRPRTPSETGSFPNPHPLV